jgi:membrane protease YdiL (CAAX protease family)
MSSTGHFLANLHVYFPILPPPALGWWRFGSQTKDHYLLFGVLWIVHAFGEELFFRGYVYRRLKTLIAPRAAFWACVLVFCTAHLNDPANYLKLVVFSALITASYDYGRSFLMPVTMHSALNTFAFCRTIWVLERESAPPRVFLVLAINLLCCLTYWAISFRRDRLRQFARRLASRVR